MSETSGIFPFKQFEEDFFHDGFNKRDSLQRLPSFSEWTIFKYWGFAGINKLNSR